MNLDELAFGLILELYGQVRTLEDRVAQVTRERDEARALIESVTSLAAAQDGAADDA